MHSNGVSKLPFRRHPQGEGPWEARELTAAAGVAGALELAWGDGRAGERRAHLSPSSPIAELPNCLLDTLLGLLDVRDRVRLLATCRRLYALHDTSVCLWGDAALHLASPRQAAQLAAALAAARPAARRLALGQAPSAARGCSQEQAAATAALACALGGLGATLESLAWAPGADPGAALAASWAPGCLPQLRSLTLLTRGPLTLPAALGAALPTLRELCIIERLARPSAPFFLGGPAAGALAAGSSELALEPGCLPEGLLRLELSAAGLLALPGALARATALTALRFDNGGAPCSLGGLSALRALRRLALPDAWPTPGALEEVGRLPALECLELPCSGGGHGAAGVVGGVGLGAVAAHHAAEVAEVLQGVAALEGLTELQLGGWELEAVPAELLTMPSLRALHLEANPCLRLVPLPELGPDCQLTTLTLDASAALDSLPALRSMPRLAALRLSNMRSRGVPWRHSAVGRVWAALSAGGSASLQRVWAGPGPSEEEQEARAARLGGLVEAGE